MVIWWRPLPACLLGRPLGDLLLLYFTQGSQAASSLSFGATNLYQWLPDNHFDLLFPAALGLAALAAISFIVMVCRRQPVTLSDEGLTLPPRSCCWY